MSFIGSIVPNRIKRSLLNARFAYRRATAPLRPLPDFVILGGQKCGTTSLFNYLLAHPHVRPSIGKEVHYFDFHPTESVSWYKAHFPIKIRKTYLVGEASPYYLFHPMTPERMSKTIPDAKLIVLLRDPVERAFSHYRHECRYQTETLSFAEALDQEPARLQGEEEKIMADPHYFSRAHVSHSYMARGMYAEQIERWLTFFPKESFLFLESSRLFLDPDATMRDVYTHLGMPYHRTASYRTFNKTPGTQPMRTEDRERLTQLYLAPNRALKKLVGIDFKTKTPCDPSSVTAGVHLS